MEIIHEIIRESVSGGFMKFCGYVIMVGLILGLPSQAIIYVSHYIYKSIKTK